MKNPYLVLLGGGFISEITENYLNENNFNCMVIDRKVFDIECNDFLEFGIEKIPKHSTLVLIASVTRLVGNGYSDFKKNIKITENIIELNKYIQGHIIYLSTIDVYGFQPSLPINEDNLVTPRDYYSLSKIVSEFMIIEESKKIKTPFTVLRLSGIYGKHSKDKSVIRSFINAAFSSQKIQVFSEENILRDYVWANDVAKIIQSASAKVISGVFNIGTGVSKSIKEIAELIATNSNARIVIIPDQLNSNRDNSLIFDMHKFYKYFPDFIFTEMDEGIKEYISYQKTISNY